MSSHTARNILERKVEVLKFIRRIFPEARMGRAAGGGRTVILVSSNSINSESDW